MPPFIFHEDPLKGPRNIENELKPTPFLSTT